MSSNMSLDSSETLLRISPNDSIVNPLRRVMEKLPREIAVSFFSFCHDEKTRCILIKPMDDPRSIVTSWMVGAESSNMMKQRVDERPGARAMCGMHYHASRLIYDNQRVIFKNNIERNVFG